MKLKPSLRPRWRWPYPYAWRQVFTNIIGLLIGFLALAYLLDSLKGTLP